MTMKSTDLDVDTPEKVPNVLRDAAQDYYESAAELPTFHSDPGAGRIWNKIARILERAADSIEKEIAKGY